MSSALSGMRLEGISAYAPEHVWSNARVAARLRLERMRTRAAGSGPMGAEEAKLFETSDRWVRRFVGFQERRFSSQGEGTIDLAARAAEDLLERTGTDRAEIDAILFGTVTPSYLYSPPDAALLQDRLGIPPWRGGIPREIKGVDVSLACSDGILAFCPRLFRHSAREDTDRHCEERQRRRNRGFLLWRDFWIASREPAIGRA